MVIQVCIGSACHLKGSYEVIERMKKIIAERHLEEKIELKSSFCLGACGQGVSVKVDNEPVVSLSPNDIESFIFNLMAE